MTPCVRRLVCRCRDTVRRSMCFGLPFLLIGLFVGCRKQPRTIGYWSGEGYEMVRIRVIDQSTDKPIAGARVWLLTSDAAAAYEGFKHSPENFRKANGAIERFGSRVFTDRDGAVSISSPFEADGGIMSEGPNTSNRRVSGYLIVEDWAYERVETKLESLLPKKFGQKDEISVVVRLKNRAEKTSSGQSH